MLAKPLVVPTKSLALPRGHHEPAGFRQFAHRAMLSVGEAGLARADCPASQMFDPSLFCNVVWSRFKD